MNVEQRLITALHTTDAVEPSPDLWSRVVHSIDEDRTHRRRVRSAVVATIGAVAAATLVGVLALTDGPAGTYVTPWVMELLATAVLATLVVVLGPAIRRFGRNFAEDLWPAAPRRAAMLLRLLDVAYYLVFVGFILVTADFTFAATVPGNAQCFVPDETCHLWSTQLEDAGGRVGGLMLVMGVLHGATIAVLPVVALVDNSTRRGRALPGWLRGVMAAGAVGAALLLVLVMVSLLVGAAGA